MGLALRSSVVILIATVLAGSASAQAPLGDLNTGGWDPGSVSEPEFAELGGILYITANTSAAGEELYWADDTGSGLVADICPGADGSYAKELVAANGLLWFAADDGVHGFEPWVSDGTASGTRMLADLTPAGTLVNPGTPPRPQEFVGTPWGTFFIIDPSGSSQPHQLWMSDGTAAGTQVIATLSTFTPSDGWALTYIGGHLFVNSFADGPWGLHVFDPQSSTLTPLGPGQAKSFATFGGSVWLQTSGGLWKTDGTAAGTSALAAPGIGGGEHLAVAGNYLVFDASSSAGTELHATDGTAAGTAMLLDAVPGAESSMPFGLRSLGNYVLCFADVTADGEAKDLFRTNGTPQGTISLGPVDEPGEPLVCGGKFFWQETLLWVSDGTAAGTTFLMDASPGSTATYGGHWGRVLHQFGSRVVFYAGELWGYGGFSQYHEPWVSDGTVAGTSMLANLHPPITGDSWGGRAVSFHGKRIFVAETDNGDHIYASDGTPAGTLPLTAPPQSAEESIPFVMGDELFFALDDPAIGTELWKSDGTPSGTVLVKDIQAGSTSSWPTDFIEYRGELFFEAYYSLWKSDGTTAGTTIVKSGARFNSPAVVNDQLLFYGDRDRDLWISDGTTAGTYKLSADHGRNYATSFFELGNKAVFAGKDLVIEDLYEASRYAEPWVTDGTLAGTFRLANICANRWSGPSNFTRLGDQMLFTASDLTFAPDTGTLGRELWVTDGTAAGTRLVLDIHPTHRRSSSPNHLTPLGDRLLFVASEPVHGSELWITDGSTAGTTLLADIRPGWYGSAIWGIVGTPDRCFFIADDGTTGRQLYVSDGTAAGTRRITAPCPGVASEVSSVFQNGSGNSAVFVRSCGMETGLWVSDGTPQGTFYVGPSTPLASFADVEYPGTAGEHLFYAADDGISGMEPYAVPLRSLRAAQVEPYGRGCTGSHGAAPRLSTTEVPSIGNLGFALQVDDAAPSSTCFVIAGLRRDLLAAPGACSLYAASIGLTTDPLVADLGGAATFAIPIPYLPVLVGLPVYLQGASIDPGGTHLGLGALSNGLLVIIGS